MCSETPSMNSEWTDIRWTLMFGVWYVHLFHIKQCLHCWLHMFFHDNNISTYSHAVMSCNLIVIMHD